MEFPPPIYFFNGINYNPSYFNFVLSNDIITSEYANTLYLKKIGDTSTGTQNFLTSFNASAIEPAPFPPFFISAPVSFYDTLDAPLNILNSSNTSSICNFNVPLTIGYNQTDLSNINQRAYNSYNILIIPINNVSGTVYPLLVLPVLTKGSYLLTYSITFSISGASVTASQIWTGFARVAAISTGLAGCYQYCAHNISYNAGDVAIFSGSGIYDLNLDNITPNLLARFTFSGSGTVQITGNYKYLRIG